MKSAKLCTSTGLHLGIAVLTAIALMMLVGFSPTQAQQSRPGGMLGTAPPPDPAPEVLINDFSYTPVPLTVKVGTTVKWINHDDIPHTVDSTQGKFKSGALDTDEKFEFRFTEAGEFPFYCRIHPKMTGKIIVQP